MPYLTQIWEMLDWIFFFQIASGSFLGVFVFLFVLPLVPTAIKLLANEPNRFRASPSKEWDYPPSTFGFFTELNPGRVKIIERGGRFIKCIMRYDDHRFLGEREDVRDPRSAIYWEVIKNSNPDDPDSYPITFPRFRINVKGIGDLIRFLIGLIFSPIRILWWVWKLWVYTLTGYVFTGIYPFQQVRVYPIRRYKIVKPGNKHEEIADIQDYSDHFRVADAQFPVFVPMAETQDKIPVKVMVDAMLRVFNPYDAAYGIDDWSARSTSAISDEVSHFTRPRPLNQVLSAEKSDEVRALSESIMRIGDRNISPIPKNNLVSIGIQVTQALVPDISLARDQDVEALGDVARARVDRDAKKERAKGDAAQLNEQAKVMKKHGHLGLAVLAAERNVRTAGAAGDKAIVVVGGEGSTDPIQAAMLRELQEINRNQGN